MRMQADRLLLDALTGSYHDNPHHTARDETVRRRFSLLIAHEIGHTLGLRHQFIASAQGMSSVMDYPFPDIPLDSQGAPILRNAFPREIRAWDKAAIFYGYHAYPASEEVFDLKALIEENERLGLHWMSDEDTGDANPFVQKWDRGTDPIGELKKVLILRQAALTRFSKHVILSDRPLGVLQDALAPLYLLHQFEVRAVASMLGGYDYRYSMRDGQLPVAISGSQQRQAPDALLNTLDAATLWPDRHLLELMAPRPPTFSGSDESFSGDTGQIFDVLRPVENAASLTMAEILKPTRAARLAQATARDQNALGFDEVLSEVVRRTWKSRAQTGSAGAAQRAIALTVLRALLPCATSKTLPMAVRGSCWVALDDIVQWNRAHPAARDWKGAYAFAAHYRRGRGRSGRF